MNKPKFELGQTVYSMTNENKVSEHKITGIQINDQDTFDYRVSGGNRTAWEGQLHATKNEALDFLIGYYKGLIEKLEAQKEE